MSDFFTPYFSNLVSFLSEENLPITSLERLFALTTQTKRSNSKIIILGNGGSSAIASHAAIDFSKSAQIRAITFNDPSLITCLANDYGHSNWMKEALKLYACKDDLVILISSSGRSKNMLEAARYTSSQKLPLVTFTGMDLDNDLKEINSSGLNIHVPSYSYNFIENVHQCLLLSIVDAHASAVIGS